MITVEGLIKNYTRMKSSGYVPSALSGIDLSVQTGEFLAVVGRSGSGKTTLLNILGGLDRDFTGKVIVDGHELAVLSDQDMSLLRNDGIGFVFQAFHLLPHLTVLENVALPSWFGWRRDLNLVNRRAMDSLERVGLASRSKALTHELSAGEKQRVAVARAVLNRPRLLLCDEPTGNLDAETGESVLRIFLELNRDEGTTLVIATHSDRVSEAAGRRVRLEAGEMVS